MVLGHESSAVVVATASPQAHLPVGQRVALEPGAACRTCPQCLRGKYNLCPDMKFAATPPYDGTLCKYYVLPAECCHPVPDSVTDEQAALLEPLSVAVHVNRLADVSAGETVVVFGAGPVGLVCGAVARARGAAFVVIVDIAERRLELAKTFIGGNIGAFNSRGVSDVATAIKAAYPAISNGGGAHKAIDATGAEPCIAAAISVLRQGGTLVQAGMGRETVNFPIVEVAAKELVVKGSFRYGAGDYAESVRLVSEGLVKVEELVSHRFGFEECGEAFETVKRGEGVKVVIAGPK